MFTYNLFPGLLNKIAQEIMSDSEKLIEVITHYQQALEHYAKKKNDAKMLHCIFKLSHMPITRKHLEETGVGRTVNSLRRLDEVGDAARTLVTKWKDMVSKQEEQEEGEEEEGEEEAQTIKSGDTSKDAMRKSGGQREKTDDNRSNSSHRNSDKNSDKGEKFSNHRREKHKEGSHSSRASHVSTSHKDHKERERQPKERRRSYEGHSDDDRERSRSDQKEHVSNISDSDRSASSESTRDEMTSDSGNESDANEYSKSINKQSNKVESKDTKRHSESHSKDKQLSSNSSNDRKSSHKSSRSKRSVSKERTHSKSKEHTRDKSREKKKKEDDRHRDSKRDSSAKRKRDYSDSSDSEPAHKKHRSSESSKFKRYDDSDSDSSQETTAKEISDDDNRNSSQKKDASKKDSGRKEKERKESYRSSSHHNSSKSENKKYSEKSKDGNRKERSTTKENTKNDKKSDKKSESKSRSKPINKEIIKTENGICSSFGASFADALGMLEPTTSKGVAKKSKPHTVTSSPEKLKPEKSPEKRQSSKTEIPLPQLPSLPSKLEPIDIDISSLLPTITPNYRPLGNLMENIQNSRNKILNDDEALCMVMSSKNQRTKVYSGNKIVWNTVPTLFELCTRILQDNIDALEYTGGVPYCILKPVLDKATPDQLFVMEHHNPYLMEDTDELWQLHCQREFRNKQREEMETWREMYMRCLDEREAKLKTLKANIKQSQEKSTPVRKTQLAYVDSVVKPPRNVLKKQMKSGIEKRPAITPASRLTALAVAGAAGQIVVPNPGSRASSSGGSSSAHMKPKKAPLMQKTLQFLKGGRFRR